MPDFKLDNALWNSLSDEQKTLVSKSLEQHKTFLNKEFEASKETLINTEKGNWEKESLSKQETKKTHEEFLNKVPSENNRKLVSKLLENTDISTIEVEYPHLLEKEKKLYDFEKVIEGKFNELKNINLESDDDFMKRVNKEGLDPAKATDKDWERYSALKK